MMIKKFISVCLVSMLMVTPQESTYAKYPEELSVDTSNIDKLYAYKEAKYQEAKSLTDKIRYENYEQLKSIQHKIDSIFHKN